MRLSRYISLGTPNGYSDSSLVLQVFLRMPKCQLPKNNSSWTGKKGGGGRDKGNLNVLVIPKSEN